MLKISYAGCLGLSPAIFAQFTLEMRVAAQNREKNSLRPAILGVKGHSRLSMLTFQNFKIFVQFFTFVTLLKIFLKRFFYVDALNVCL